ncbi:hypothetical protein [Henriciella sp.]|uniref:hypothetical protein n=1 Tax=Henriciella sp. TaxID=1968823 RepID=UPI0026365AA4|nr:hypothetical protein [Henriciella sp.]
MSARNKYIVAAVTGVAVLGGAAAFTYYTNTQTSQPKSAFSEETPLTDEATSLAELEPAAPVTGSIEATGLEDIGVSPLETPVDTVVETHVHGDVAPADISADTQTDAGFAPGETQPE